MRRLEDRRASPRRALIECAAAALILASPATGRTLEVGPDKPLKTITEAAARVRPGDTVLIHPGIYREAVIWKGGDLNGPPITVRGVGSPRPIVDGMDVAITGAGPRPRALFQVEGDNYIFENLELRNARNGRNACGFRLLKSRKTVVRRCRIVWNDMGFQSTANDDLLVEFSEIAFNGTYEYNGLSHNFYLGGNRTTVRFCYIHDSTNGQTFKTRGRYTELLYNYIADAHDRIEGGDTTKEIGIQNGVDASEPNAHALLMGNVIIKRGTGFGFLDFGPEGKEPSRNGVLFLVNNTIVRENPAPRWMLRLGHVQERAVMHNNIFYGFVDFARGEGAENITGANNWFPVDANVPSQLKYSFRGKDPGFVDLAGRDYRLATASACIDQGGEGLHVLNGNGEDIIAAAASEYRAHMREAARPKAGRIDIGALEYDPSVFANARGVLEGTLTGRDGQPIGGIPIVLEGPVSVSTRSNDTGQFRLSRLVPGEYKITPWPFRFPWDPIMQTVNVTAETAPVRFRGPETHHVRGVILDTGSNPVPGATVYLEGDASAWLISDSKGQFDFAGVQSGGRYRVRAAKSNLVLSQKGVDLPPLERDASVEIKGQLRFMIGGGILTESGEPVPNVTITISGTANVKTRTNVRGNYAALHLPQDGSFTVTPSHPGYRFEPPIRSYSSLPANERKATFTAIPVR